MTSIKLLFKRLYSFFSSLFSFKSFNSIEYNSPAPPVKPEEKEIPIRLIKVKKGKIRETRIYKGNSNRIA